MRPFHYFKKMYICEIRYNKRNGYFYGERDNAIVRRIEVLGCIERFWYNQKYTKFEIDDGTGSMDCIQFKKKNARTVNKDAASEAVQELCAKLNKQATLYERKLQRGDMYWVRGRLKRYNSKFQIILDTMHRVVLYDDRAKFILRLENERAQLEDFKRKAKAADERERLMAIEEQKRGFLEDTDTLDNDFMAIEEQKREFLEDTETCDGFPDEPPTVKRLKSLEK